MANTAEAFNTLDKVLPRLAEIQLEMTARVNQRIEEDGKRYWYIPDDLLAEGEICDFRSVTFDKEKLLNAATVAAPEKVSDLSEALTIIEQLAEDIATLEKTGLTYGGSVTIEDDLENPVYARANSNINRLLDLQALWQLTPDYRDREG